MDPTEKRELRRKAWIRLSAQRRRAGLLRGRVVVLSLICFAVLWAIVFAQMATGNDPVLSAKQATVATRAARGAGGEVETTDARELERERAAKRAKARADEEATEAEPEVEAEVVEAEPEEVAPQEVEPEFEEVEPEPLVTSQS
jgi:non-ribosomal peptide synthetase component E (peptide arylation enzyme)